MKFTTLLVSTLLLIGLVSAKGPKCATLCPQNFSPLCGFNGDCYVNFGNQCEMNVGSCTSGTTFLSVGFDECDKPGARHCPPEIFATEY